MNKKLLSIILLVVGAGLIFWGYQLSGSVSSQFSKSLTGSFSDKIMLHYIGGAVCIAVGLFLAKK
ncbi:hypothetical protein SIN8267_01837 [Sinobacterium norvegicum]|uniref:DUF3185 family protein n=1 Tax=Sinobacterium norvegicum TaxID=1641715 RepID=A0ABN8EH79_9GAMM|nr:DUF3185 family protein [Sinobacterium norvegicum]CAH0991723.1 hypothetical protein SIN8267_01837 [Sinobacterium norvegicum]